MLSMDYTITSGKLMVEDFCKKNSNGTNPSSGNEKKEN